jgi:hypothetical protein
MLFELLKPYPGLEDYEMLKEGKGRAKFKEIGQAHVALAGNFLILCI